MRWDKIRSKISSAWAKSKSFLSEEKSFLSLQNFFFSLFLGRKSYYMRDIFICYRYCVIFAMLCDSQIWDEDTHQVNVWAKEKRKHKVSRFLSSTFVTYVNCWWWNFFRERDEMFWEISLNSKIASFFSPNKNSIHQI